MQIEMKWTEVVQHTSTIGINVDNVEAAGLDPTSADDLLIYVRDHMDPVNLVDQLPKDYSDAFTLSPVFLEVTEIDLKAQDSAVA